MKVLILGYGDVGKTVARILLSRGVEVIVVDTKEIWPDEGVEFFRADVMNGKFWEEFDFSDFNSAVIALPKDFDAVFCILAIKRKVPDIEVFVRCNEVENVRKMYSAGADHVFVLPIVAAEMILNEIFGESIRKRLNFENVEIAVFEVKEGMEYTIEDIERMGVRFLGAELNGERYEGNILRKGCKVAVAGKSENIEKLEIEISERLRL
ncbi:MULTISPECIES: potassium channel family protein [unclassified Archaeoglobus]|jgi:Trk K+ transport system NAD-binding subunit|uniref:potassium channel family protein n=1 Tax=unclassified Archaeoglobus TaxID=2643606 RepID=UPI0025B7FCC5|nr:MULTISPECIES: NAD(P)-binding protein [unclassified Archaeoglobus]